MGFDPYETWLGIPPDRRPPTHYDLLGLAPYESDPAAIDQAALRRMSKVRQHQLGPQSDLSQEILSELARARLILMDPDRRTDYDAKLQTRSETRPGPLVAPQKVRNGDALLHRPGRHEDAPDVLGSLALTERAGDGPSSLPCAPDEGRAWWKKAFVIGPFVVCVAVLIGVVLYSAFSPSSLKHRPRDLVRNDSDRLTPTQRPKPSLPPAPKPVVTPEPAPPPIVEPPRADPPGGGGEQETPADVNLGRDKDDDRPDGLGQASKKSDLAAEDSPEQRLKDLGLQRVGTRYVLQQESEVRQKLEQAQASFNQCLSYLSQKNEMEAKLATFKSLSDTIIALRHDIDSANLTLNAWPPRYSNVEKDDFRAATAVRDSLEGEHIEARAQLDPKQA
jgi:hypothetical protein